MLLSAFLLIKPVSAEESGYQDISVQQAKHMIKHTPEMVILDVRNQSEYNQGHIHGAILIPLYQLNARINELRADMNNSILIYCKGGYRSIIASQLLETNNFTRIYNMIGGIDSWMQAEYPIDTSYHYVSVDVENNETTCQIEPWLLHIANCTACQNQQCSRTIQDLDLVNVTQTYLENTATHQVIQVNDTITALHCTRLIRRYYGISANQKIQSIVQ